MLWIRLINANVCKLVSKVLVKYFNEEKFRHFFKILNNYFEQN